MLLANSGHATAAKIVLNAGTVALLRRSAVRSLCTKPPTSGLYGADTQSTATFGEPLRKPSKVLEWATRLLAVGFLGGAIFAVVTKYRERARRRESFQQLPKHKGVKVNN
jgi:hypothetical protein